MKLVVISSPDSVFTEIQEVVKLLDNGLESFHLRKPKFTKIQIEEYLKDFPAKYHKQIVLHSHHKLAKKYKLKGIHLTRKHKKKKFKCWWNILTMRLSNRNAVVTSSFHSISNVLQNSTRHSYVFFSPVFDSISKEGYQGDFTDKNLTFALQRTKQNMIALGGVSSDNIEKAFDLGFTGVALLGAIWHYNRDSLEEFLRAKELCDRLGVPKKKVLPELS